MKNASKPCSQCVCKIMDIFPKLFGEEIYARCLFYMSQYIFPKHGNQIHSLKYPWHVLKNDH